MPSADTVGREPTVVVFGDVDINLIDGSSVWLVSLCAVLNRLPVRGHILLKAEMERDVLSRELVELERFRVWEPSDVQVEGRVVPERLVDALSNIDEVDSLDVVIVRGLKASIRLAASGRFDSRLWPYLTDIPQSAEEMTQERVEELNEVFEASGRILCQTESLRSFLVSFFPDHDSKMILLPPMVPDEAFVAHRRDTGSGGIKLFYAGKFAPLWGIEEMLEAVRETRVGHPEVTITIAGDKIHNPAEDPSYLKRIEAGLGAGGVEWLGGVDRSSVFETLADVDLAISVRDRQLDTSREISTKLLEYAAAGVPAIVNRTLAHQELLGDAYPLFVDGPNGISNVVSEVALDSSLLADARRGLGDVAARYSMNSVAGLIRPAVESSVAWGGTDLSGRRIVVAGHELKFATELIQGLKSAGADVRLDTWGGHDIHDEERSTELAMWADTVVCEWCLSNAVWYSKHKQPDQRLIVRFHRSELDSPWPSEVDMDTVDAMVFVSGHVRDQAQRRFGWDNQTLTVVPNFVDTVAFDRPKLPGARFTLGILGFLPRLKRLDLALDVLERLRAQDQRYRLVVKGVLPWDLNWVWKRDDERRYFEEQFDRIRSVPDLRDAVVFDRPGGDVPAWFRKVGFILSVSDIESFHLALIEGMASRSVPIVIDRDGASSIVDDRWIVRDEFDAAKRIISTSDVDVDSLGALAQEEAVARYGLGGTARAWLDLM
jgi:glycosyltransferase involved in cell wall biosynthesis